MRLAGKEGERECCVRIVLNNNPSNSCPASRGQVGRSLRAEVDEDEGVRRQQCAFYELTLSSDLAHKLSHLSGEDLVHKAPGLKRTGMANAPVQRALNA
ncbi:uncharacterized [Tachysurus ichikawai]